MKIMKFIATEECTWKTNGCLHCCLPGSLLELVASLCHCPTLKCGGNGDWKGWLSSGAKTEPRGSRNGPKSNGGQLCNLMLQ